VSRKDETGDEPPFALGHLARRQALPADRCRVRSPGAGTPRALARHPRGGAGPARHVRDDGRLALRPADLMMTGTARRGAAVTDHIRSVTTALPNRPMPSGQPLDRKRRQPACKVCTMPTQPTGRELDRLSMVRRRGPPLGDRGKPGGDREAPWGRALGVAHRRARADGLGPDQGPGARPAATLDLEG
jgi:hypothetical protein